MSSISAAWGPSVNGTTLLGRDRSTNEHTHQGTVDIPIETKAVNKQKEEYRNDFVDPVARKHLDELIAAKVFEFELTADRIARTAPFGNTPSTRRP